MNRDILREVLYYWVSALHPKKKEKQKKSLRSLPVRDPFLAWRYGGTWEGENCEGRMKAP